MNCFIIYSSVEKVILKKKQVLAVSLGLKKIKMAIELWNTRVLTEKYLPSQLKAVLYT